MVLGWAQATPGSLETLRSSWRGAGWGEWGGGRSGGGQGGVGAGMNALILLCWGGIPPRMQEGQALSRGLHVGGSAVEQGAQGMEGLQARRGRGTGSGGSHNVTEVT